MSYIDPGIKLPEAFSDHVTQAEDNHGLPRDAIFLSQEPIQSPVLSDREDPFPEKGKRSYHVRAQLLI